MEKRIIIFGLRVMSKDSQCIKLHIRRVFHLEGNTLQKYISIIMKLNLSLISLLSVSWRSPDFSNKTLGGSVPKRWQGENLLFLKIFLITANLCTLYI